MNGEAVPLRLWVQSTAQLARRLEYSKEKFRHVFAIFFALAADLFPAATAMLILLSLIVIFPMRLVGMAGFSR